jgi:hypothetical protein
MKFVCVLRKQVIQEATIVIDAVDDDEAAEKADEYLFRNKHSIKWAEGEWAPDDDMFEVVRVEAEQ